MRCQNTNVVFLFLSNLQIYDFFAKKRNENLGRLFISSYESLKKALLRNAFPKNPYFSGIHS